jgi:hypothetical protein
MDHNTLTTSDGKSLVVFTLDGDLKMINETHTHYLRIVSALENDEDPTRFLDGSYVAVVANLSARVSVRDGILHFDGDPVYNGLATTIQRYNAEGRDGTNLVRFMERLSSNPIAHSREQLFDWVQAQQGLTIDNDGFVIGFKGVYSRDSDQDFLNKETGEPLFPLDKYPYRSSHSGHGVVDGVEVTGYLPMGVGVTVEMPRDEVNHNPRQGCSTGLHVGTFAYAKGYSRSGALLEVRFDPADVVSVPSECGYAKLRCCKYTGVAIHDEVEKNGDLTDYEPEANFDEEAAWNEFVEAKPEGFFAAVRNRLRRNRGQEVEV